MLRLGNSGALNAVLVPLLLCAIFAGIALRFYHYQTPMFWGDEAITALRVAGYKSSDVIAAANAPTGIPAISLRRFRQIGSHGPLDVVRSFAIEDVQHPPLYYLLAYYWERITGGDGQNLRLLSVLISLLLIPAAFWLARELFHNFGVALTASALASVSPFAIGYAQQAREYALWAVTVCLATAALLRAIRRARPVDWWLYALLLALGMYTHVFFSLVLVAHAAYIIGCRRSLDSATTKRFTLALVGALVFSLPWLIVFAYGQVLYPYFHQADHGISAYQRQNLKGILYSWLAGLPVAFGDLEWFQLRYVPLTLCVLVLEIGAMTTLIRKATFRQWWLVFCLAASCLLLQIGNLGVTSVPRYLTPALLALLIAVDFFFGRLLFCERVGRARRITAFVGLVALICVCIFDDVVRGTQRLWWTNDFGLPVPMPAVAQRIDRDAGASLVIGWAPRDWQAIFELAPFLRPADRVSFDAQPRAVRAALHQGMHVFAVSRWDDLEDSLSSNFAVHALSVPIAQRGYDLVARALHASRVMPTQVTWLWSVHEKEALRPPIKTVR